MHDSMCKDWAMIDGVYAMEVYLCRGSFVSEVD